MSYRNKLQVINPLEDYLYIRLCFHSWRKFAGNLKQRAKSCLENEGEMALFYVNSESKESSQAQEGEFMLSAIREEEEEMEGLPPSPTGKEIVENMEIEIKGNYLVPELAIKGFSDDESRDCKRGSGMGLEGFRLPGFIEEKQR